MSAHAAVFCQSSGCFVADTWLPDLVKCSGCGLGQILAEKKFQLTGYFKLVLGYNHTSLGLILVSNVMSLA